MVENIQHGLNLQMEVTDYIMAFKKINQNYAHLQQKVLDIH